MIDTPGCYSISADEYHADPCPSPSLSASIATILIQQSPMHAKAAHPRLTPNPVREEAKHLDLGTICHALMLEGIDVAHVITATKKEGSGKNRIDTGEPVTDYKTKDAQTERDAARAASKCPVLAHEMPEILSMMDACRMQLATHRDAYDAFTNGKPEQTLVWREPSGIWCRARVDWMMNDRPSMYDYKTGKRSARPSDVSRIAAGAGWTIQAAFYRRGFKAVFGQDLEPDFRFVAQENFAPYALSVLELSPADLALAEAQVDVAINRFAECLQSGIWPGYSRNVERIISPAYLEMAWQESQLEEV